MMWRSRYTVAVPPGVSAGQDFEAALPPRPAAGTRGVPGARSAGSAASSSRGLAARGPLPLPALDTVRQLVRLGFTPGQSKWAARATAGGGGVPSAARWAQAARARRQSGAAGAGAGGGANEVESPSPLAAGCWRLDIALA
jgi:hypothetical protein